jgi:hypothetical protein
LAARAIPVNSDDLSKLLRALERIVFFGTLQSYARRYTVDLVDLALGFRFGREKLDAVVAAIDNSAKKIDFADSALFAGDPARTHGYYGWRAIRYFLFEYEQSLKRKSKSNRDKLEWSDFVSEDYGGDYVTVEHVFPQRPKDPYWDKHFKGFSPRQRIALRNSLGNLLALSRPKNASLSNKPFPEKRDGDSESPGYRHGSYSEIEVTSLQDWTPQEILKRGMRMLEFLEKRWDVTLGDAAAKTRMLGLEFMAPKAP